ncbi:MAG: sigma-70 family RNA polymerase sigma factor [Verrucomicrobia bacterium]|nr:sigma-70 family RNA polymerase sigma factor [Verrucomicrobiota bacterium]
MQRWSPSLDSAVSGKWFATTHWSVVLAAGQEESPQAAEALGQLGQTYWYPLYAYVRREGHSAHDAQDLTQGFFARLLERKDLQSVHPQKGKFRSFLLASLKHFLANEWDRTQAVKRGAAYQFVSWDAADAERRYGQEPSHGLTADRLFERRWALTLLEKTLEDLKQKRAADGKAEWFDALQVYLSGGPNARPYAEIAAELGMSEGALKVAVHRLRRRYGELMRKEIAHTVSRLEDIDDEIRHLFAVVAA